MEERTEQRIRQSELKSTQNITKVVDSFDRQIARLSESIDQKLQNQIEALSSSLNSQVATLRSMIMKLSSQLQSLSTPRSDLSLSPSQTATPMNLDSSTKEEKPDSDRPKKLQHIEAKARDPENSQTKHDSGTLQQPMAHTNTSAISELTNG